jgi:4-hydroxybenzoate polyprenyltransferase
MFQKLFCYSRLLRFHRPIGILLLLWPTLIALWLAGKGSPDTFLVFIFVMGVIVMRSAGCVVNDMTDRDLDGYVTRTQLRPLVTGDVSCKEAATLFGSLILCGLILVLQLNILTIMLSGIALILAVIYPFMKRYTHFPQMVLGAAFGWSIPMAFSAQTNSVPFEAWLLYLATICWVVAYDTQYAMVDREDDLKIGIKSTAIFFGKADRWIILGFHFLSLFLFAWAGKCCHQNRCYYLGILTAMGFALYQFWLTKNRDPHSCFKAFLNNNYLGASLFLGVLL